MRTSKIRIIQVCPAMIILSDQVSQKQDLRKDTTKVKELIKEYVRIYGHNEWGVATYDGNVGLINNYIIPTIGEVQLSEINNHFMEKYYTDLLKMPAVKSSRNPDGDKLITAATVHQIHKVLRSCFRR